MSYFSVGAPVIYDDGMHNKDDGNTQMRDATAGAVSSADWDDFLTHLLSDEEELMMAAAAELDGSSAVAPSSLMANAVSGAAQTRDYVHNNQRMTSAQTGRSFDFSCDNDSSDTDRTITASQKRFTQRNDTYGSHTTSATGSNSWAGISSDPMALTPLSNGQPHMSSQMTFAAGGPIISLIPTTVGTPPQIGLNTDSHNTTTRDASALSPYTALRTGCVDIHSRRSSQTDAHLSAPPRRVLAGNATGLGPLPPSSTVNFVAATAHVGESTTGSSLYPIPPTAMSGPTTLARTGAPGATDAETLSNDDPVVQSNLFVCGLAPDINDAALEALFAPYGDIESAKVMLDIHTGRGRCIAFVKYTTVEAARAAMDALNGAVVHSQCLKVRVANTRAAYLPGNPTNKTFLRNVPQSVTRAHLAKYFSAFGEVTDISIHPDSAGHGNARKAVGGASLTSLEKAQSAASTTADVPPQLNIAFITFTTKEAAAAAAANTHTRMPFKSCKGVPLLAKVAEDSARRVQRLSRRQRTSSHCAAAGVPSSSAAVNASALTSPPGSALGMVDGNLYYATAPATVRASTTDTSASVGGATVQAPPSYGASSRAPQPSNTSAAQPQQQPQQQFPALVPCANGYPSQSQTQQQMVTVLVPNGQGQAVTMQVLASVPAPPQTYANPMMMVPLSGVNVLQPPQSQGYPYYMVPSSHPAAQTQRS